MLFPPPAGETETRTAGARSTGRPPRGGARPTPLVSHTHEITPEITPDHRPTTREMRGPDIRAPMPRPVGVEPHW
jgi:hypothetical protein